MLQNFLENETFGGLMRGCMKEIINLLFKEGVHFSILANLEKVEFNPELPKELTSKFKPITMFVLAGYTFQSGHIKEDSLIFEAGFGTENIGSIVSIPLDAILQIAVEETPILINLSIPKEESQDRSFEEKSMEALLANPENKKLFK